MTVEEGMLGLRVCKTLYDSIKGAARLNVHKHKSMVHTKFLRTISLVYAGIITVRIGDRLYCADKHIPTIKVTLSTIWTMTDMGDGRRQVISAHIAQSSRYMA